MPPIPPEQSAEHSTPPPRGPHDHGTRPHGRTKHRPAAQRDNRSGEAAGPHQRHGDRGSGDDDSAARYALPTFVRYADLIAAGIVANWTTLLRLIDTEGFPVGIMIGANTRAWRLDDVEAWLASRPTARKVIPPDAVHPRVRDKRADAERVTP
jgi:hypothetical protein